MTTNNDKVTYLLGAGASVEAGMPVARRMTEAVVARLNSLNWPGDSDLGRALNFIVSAMIVHSSRDGGRPDEMPDIESVVSAVELLSKRQDVELAPFIQNWDPAVNALDSSSKLRSFWAKDFRRKLFGEDRRNRNPLFIEQDVEKLLREFVRAETGSGTGFHYAELHARLVMLLKQLLHLPDAGAANYLMPLVAEGADGRSITIATLNYDLTVESAAGTRGANISTGIDSWSSQWKLNWPNEGIKLIKLHGSINWRRTRDEPRKQRHTKNDIPLTLPRTVITVESDIDPDRYDREIPFVVYGRREKLRPEGPFLDLRAEFIKELQVSSHLIVVGYSFRDDHLNEIIRQWLSVDSRRALVVVDPGFPSSFQEAEGFQSELLLHLRRTRATRSHEELDESRLLVLTEPASTALPKICGLSPADLNQLILDLRGTEISRWSQNDPSDTPPDGQSAV